MDNGISDTAFSGLAEQHYGTLLYLHRRCFKELRKQAQMSSKEHDEMIMVALMKG